MKGFLARRFAYMVFTLFAATVIVFGLSRMTGDPRLLYAKPGGYGITPEQYEALGKKLGLDKPLVVQYFMWLGRTLKGDLGETLLDEAPVIQVVGEKFPNTLQLALAAILYAVLVGLPLGVVSAIKRGTVWDYIARSYALLGMALPQFWIGLMAILVVSVHLDWLPSGSRSLSGAFPLSWENLKYFIMPALILGWLPAASFMRITRSAMLEILDSESIKFARAKGVRERTVIWKHAFKNSLIPPLTMVAITLAGFLGGAVVVEQVFSWPGIGRLALQSIYNNDFPVLTACVLLFAILFAVTSFLADIGYAYVDPRIRYA